MPAPPRVVVAERELVPAGGFATRAATTLAELERALVYGEAAVAAIADFLALRPESEPSSTGALAALGVVGATEGEVAAIVPRAPH